MAKPLFSIVMAAFNVEKYISDAIDSILNQDFPLDMIQLIIVDDGSNDNTGKICDEYLEKYPDIIEVIHQKNAGVSSARNKGLEKARGKYVNFLDSDDKLAPNALREVYDFFQNNGKKTNVVSIPIYFFEASTGEHMLNNKFNRGTRIISLIDEPDKKQLHIASSFIKASAIGSLRFDTKLRYAEDAKFLIQLFLENPVLGVVCETKYHYRARSSQNSAIQTSSRNREWYIPFVDSFYRDVIKLSRKKYGYIPKFVQHIIAYDLQFKISIPILPNDILSSKERKDFKADVLDIYNDIDDDVIIAQEQMFIEPKLMILAIKHNAHPELKEKNGRVVYCFDTTEFFSINDTLIRIERVEMSENRLKIDGWVPYSNFGEKDFLPLFFEVNGRRVDPKIEKRRSLLFDKSMDTVMFTRMGFSFDIKLPNSELVEINIMRETPYGEVHATDQIFESISPLSDELHHSYYACAGWILTQKNGQLLLRKSKGGFSIVRNEVKLLAELFKLHEKRVILYRLCCLLLRQLKKKPIWIISDRINKAGDNGEALFKYVEAHEKNIRSFFVLSEESEDFNALRKYGKVVPFGSIRHRILYLLCDYHISSSADENMMMPFLDRSIFFKDILQKIRFVFLQHGVTQSDLADWLNKYNKNFYGFVTVSESERKSILNNKNYYYKEDDIWLTGFPRFDSLYDDSGNIITIMPTWRKWLFSNIDPETGIWNLADNFKESQFYKTYNNLINHPRLINELKKRDYKLIFMPHPTLLPYISYFEKNEYVKFCDGDMPYRDIYAKSNLIVTDYSSVVFDFAFLKKPIIYFQFDKKRFLGGEHIMSSSSYFDYDKNGFGDVLFDIDSLIDNIISNLDNDCQMDNKYKKRVDSFFAYHDKNNCKRVVSKLIRK